MKTFKLYYDATAYGMGTCLVHVMDDDSEKPVVHVSCTLTMAYAQIESEGLALVFDICQFYQYLYSQLFILVTDHGLCKIFGSRGIIPTMNTA